jgi:hypothetical protein
MTTETDVRGTRIWVYAKDVHYGDQIGRHMITAATRREDGKIAVTFDDGKVVHEETVDFMFRVVRPFCQFEWEAAGPHEGCAEFSAPDTFDCEATATIGVPWTDAYTGNEEVLLVCVDHLSSMVEPGQEEPFPLALKP